MAVEHLPIVRKRASVSRKAVKAAAAAHRSDKTDTAVMLTLRHEVKCYVQNHELVVELETYAKEQ